MSDKQRTFGQYSTPVDVADLILGFCLRRPQDRVLDPSCGPGELLARAATLQARLAGTSRPLPGTLHGVELDPAAAAQARAAIPEAHILAGNFFTLEPDQPPYDAIVGNPPYTRAEWIGRLADGAAAQLAMFPGEAEGDEALRQPLLPGKLATSLSRRSGLHAYFFLHSYPFLREGGRLGFVVPNGWLDVAYGAGLKQFLLDHFCLLAIVESSVERWFRRARVNTCLVILEKCSGPNRRAGNRVRLVRLLRPLAELLPFAPESTQRPAALERLVGRLLPPDDVRQPDRAIRVVAQAELSPGEKWGLPLRAPASYRRRARQPGLAPLGQWATVERGFTTGANAFFYLDEESLAQWGIEAPFYRPLLKSLRHVDRLEVGQEQCRHVVLLVPPFASLPGTRLAAYLAHGEASGVARRRTCASRHPWFGLVPQAPAHLLLPKGVWSRHLAPLMSEALQVDQQLYRVTLAPGVPAWATAALFNSTWFQLQLELHGRTNFGEGVLWLAAYELGQLPLPDPRLMAQAECDALAEALVPLRRRSIGPTLQELARPDRQRLDQVVAEILGLSPSETSSLQQALAERITSRLRKAGHSPDQVPS